MKNIFIIILLAFSFNSFSQSFTYALEPVDSNNRSGKWVIRTIAITKEGGSTIETSPEQDSAAIVEYFVTIIENKVTAILGETRAMKNILAKSIGVSFDQAKSAVLGSKIQGSYSLITPTDTLAVSINKNMQILSGKNKGTVKVENGQLIITGAGIVPGTESLDIKTLALFENKKYKLVKD